LREHRTDDQVIRNALIESFCIHARNLNEFLLENGRPDTLKATSFADDNYQPPLVTEVRQALFSKINKQISHLTEDRTSSAEDKIGDLQREQMYSVLFDELQRFSQHLNPELRASWKVIFGAASEVREDAGTEASHGSEGGLGDEKEETKTVEPGFFSLDSVFWAIVGGLLGYGLGKLFNLF
jgi:hypothetical protein